MREWLRDIDFSQLFGWLVGWFQQHSLLSILHSTHSSALNGVFTTQQSTQYPAWHSTEQPTLLSSNLTASGGACDRCCNDSRLHHILNQRLFVHSELSRVCSVECSVDCWVVNTLFSAEQGVLCRMLSNECCRRLERTGFYPPLLLSCLLYDWLAGRACYSSGVNS
jgi:hypothetical protein